MFSCFLSKHPDIQEDILSPVKQKLEECNQECIGSKSFRPLEEYLAASSSQYNTLYKEFHDYLTAMANRDENWKFWMNFVLRDAYAYITLFLAIRGGLWKLRTGSIKMMAPLFTAFDRPHYRKIIPQHLRDLQTLPENIQLFCEKGAFVCSISGSNMHSVALDEAHEMLINKDIKAAVVRPTKEYPDRILFYFPVRSRALKQLKREVFLDYSQDSYSANSLFDLTPSARQVEENIITIKSKMNETAILSPEPVDHGLKSLSGKHATPEQAKDLLNFWEIGQRHCEAYVKYYILQQPSAQVPQRLNKLLTYTT